MFTPFAHLSQADLPCRDGIAIVPLASIETHGPHLPLGTDGLIAEGIIDAAAKLSASSSQVYRLPLTWLGASTEHARRPGTLSTEPEDLIAAIVALGEGLARAGIRRVVLFNGHGGNVAPGALAVLKLRSRFGLLAANVHWLDFGLPRAITPPGPAAQDVHGGWIETSVLLHLAPQLVHQKLLAARDPTTPAPSLYPSGTVSWGWLIDDLGEGGWVGHPEKASADLGRALVAHAAKGLSDLVTELAAAPWPHDR